MLCGHCHSPTRERTYTQLTAPTRPGTVFARCRCGRWCRSRRIARAQAGVLLRRLKFALPGWAQAERRRTEWRDQAAQRAAQARAYSGEGHSEEWRFELSRPYPH